MKTPRYSDRTIPVKDDGTGFKTWKIGDLTVEHSGQGSCFLTGTWCGIEQTLLISVFEMPMLLAALASGLEANRHYEREKED